MSEPMPPPSQGDSPPPPPPPAASSPPRSAGGANYVAFPRGRVPERLGGVYYSVGLVILLSIVTLGVWTILWSYRTGEDLRRYSGYGLGGGINLLFCFIAFGALFFTIPNEIKQTYESGGATAPVTAWWGLWSLLPFIGWIIWYVKVQNALNDFWLSKGAQPG